MSVITVMDPDIGKGNNGWIPKITVNNDTDNSSDSSGQQNGHVNDPSQNYPNDPQKSLPILEPLSSLKQTVVTQNVGPVFGPFPTPVRCPHCFNYSLSETVYVTGLATYLLIAGCCCMGLWCCCCAPLCLDSAKDVHHYCPHCKVFLGRYKKVG